MAFRLYSALHTFFGEQAQALFNGELRFFEEDTVTPKAVYADEALTISNGFVVLLDASARPDEALWGSGNYFVEIYDGPDPTGVKQGEDIVQEPGGAALTIPIPEAGEYLGGDGSQLMAIEGRFVPDPTGHANDYLQTDGTNVLWADGPADPDITVPVTVTATSMRVGATGSDFYFEQRPAADLSVSGAGLKVQTHSPTFAVPFKTGTTPDVFIELTGAGPTGANIFPKHSITAVSATGFTVTFSMLTGGTSSDEFPASDMDGDITYTYTAIGVVAEPA